MVAAVHVCVSVAVNWYRVLDTMVCARVWVGGWGVGVGGGWGGGGGRMYFASKVKIWGDWVNIAL